MNKFFPLSQTQLGIYLACQGIDENSGNYQIAQLYALPPLIDTDILAEALETVIAAHPYVKSGIVLQEGSPMLEDRRDIDWRPLVREIDSIEQVRDGFCKPMALDSGGSLFRLEIYRTPRGNWLYTDFHHIIFDGISHGIFNRQLGFVYDAILKGATMRSLFDDGSIAVEKVSGFDIAARELADRESEKFEAARKWYVDTFSECSEIDSLPLSDIYDENLKASGAYRLRERELDLSADEVSAITDRFGIKESVLFTSSFGLTLAAWTADTKASFCTVWHGRNDSDTRQCFDMCVHTLPVFVNAGPDMPLKEFFSSIAVQMKGARLNQLFSLTDCVRELNLRTDINFAYQGELVGVNSGVLTLGGETVVPEDMKTNPAGLRLSFELFKAGGKYVVRSACKVSDYSEGFINALLESFCTAVKSLEKADAAGQVEFCSPAQMARLDSFNPVFPQYDLDSTVVDFFRATVKAHPDNTAVVYKDVRYTFREVDAITDNLAAYIGKSVPKGSVVSIILNRNAYMMLAPLGVMKAGCAYQPLDPSYPRERLNFMVKDASAALLIADAGLEKLVDEFSGPVLLTDDIVSLPKGSPAATPSPEDLFILLYTSGTTGVPKGVMLLHRNISSFVQFHAGHLGIDSGSRITAYASFGFDAFMHDLATALYTGAALYVIPEEIRLDLDALHDFFDRNGITSSFMTTQVATQFALNYPVCKTLKALYTGGEKLASIPVPQYDLYNMYGPTEATVYVTSFKPGKQEPNFPIGTPTLNTHAYIVGKGFRRLPVGAAGELIVSGPQVGSGYLGRPDKTAEAFIPNSWEDAPLYAASYRTGDIVRYREDGNIEFIGRKDGQVKIRGFRIELKEVETVIRDFEDIKDATVQAFDLPSGGKALAAYIVSDKTIGIEALKEFISARKPPYMVPAVIMQIDAIPLNVNQKVDRRRLPEPEVKAASTSSGTAPLNSLERILKDMVSSLAGTEEFDVTTPLSYVGLSSIGAISLAVKIHKRFGIKVDSRVLTRGATLQSIENDILAAKILDASPADETARKPSVKAAVPLSNAQLGIYYECMKDTSNTAYNVPTCIKFPIGTSAEAVHKAVCEVIRAHPLLLTHFETSGDDIVQVYPENVEPSVEDAAGDVQEYMKTFVKPFALHRGPLYRALVVSGADGGVTLLWDAHHLVNDGGSLSIFLSDVCLALDGGTVEPESYTFFDYVHDEAASPDGGREAFFDARLTTVDGSSSLPPDKAGKEADGNLSECLKEVDIDAVEAFARKEGITPAAVFLAVTNYVTARYTNSRDTCICTISNGRSNLSISRTVGMFVNTLPIVSHIVPQSIRQYLHQTADDLGATLENENHPFARIAAKYGLRADVMYEYQLGVIPNFSTGKGNLEVSNFGLESAKFKIAVKIVSSGGRTCIKINYNDAIYSRDYVGRLLDSMSEVLRAMMADADAPLSHLSIVSPSQAAELDGIRSTAKCDVPVKLLHRGLEMNALKNAGKTALIACDASLTFSALNARANRVANALIALGVRRGDSVVVLLPRTSKVVTGIFGILKTGAAFIPCDPEYPADRIKLIIEDSEARYVLTEADRVPLYGDRAIDIGQLLLCDNETNPSVDVSPEDLAYMIYTSGSTGRPKGVMLRHIGICSYLTDHPANILMDAICSGVSAYTCITTLSFDLSLKEYAACIFNGITCVFADESQTNNPVELAALMRRTASDAINGTPSRILQYMESEEFCECLKNCKVIGSGGEKYSEVLLDRLHNLTKAKLINTYGPTEITVSGNMADLSGTDEISVGAPLLNYTEFVVDPDGNELPVGVMGELYIGGPGVAVGYKGLDKLNAERFIQYKGIRVFRSGDYARWGDKGQVFVIGRADNQVKLRGLRIELGEVESAIRKVDGIVDVIALIRSIDGREHLSAYFTADRKIDVQKLRSQIGGTLTQYMVPTAYLQMDSFPLTPNGKTDVRHLPQPQLAAAGGEYEAPAGATEKFFCELFGGILGLDKVSATDSFFDLGGTSLVVTKVIIEAQKAGYKLSYADVFSHPSARKIATLLGGSAPVEEDPDSDIKDFDYEPIRRQLALNTLDSFNEGGRRPLGNVLLTGATGFLGIHVFREIIENYPDSKVWCLLRGMDGISAGLRFQNMLYLYFEKSWAELFGKRIFIIEGDVQGRIDAPDDIQTVINCAAVVKHFSKGTEIEDVNVGGCVNCVEWCLEHGARMIQVSTMSVGGSSVNGRPAADRLTEQMLYEGQRIRNQYVHSKIMGERYVLDAVARRGLDGKVMRVGTLSARASDGEYQINFSTNSFVGRLRVYGMLGAFPYSSYENKVEFSPIDEVARAILLLSQTPRACTVFHPFNDHFRYLGDIVMTWGTLGHDIRFVEESEFKDILHDAEKDEQVQKALSSMIAYASAGGGEVVRPLEKSNTYTMQVLLRLGFRWSLTSEEYIKRFFKIMYDFNYYNL